jgi:hypothetical protein
VVPQKGGTPSHQRAFAIEQGSRTFSDGRYHGKSFVLKHCGYQQVQAWSNNQGDQPVVTISDCMNSFISHWCRSIPDV